jgi:hypothetical protein
MMKSYWTNFATNGNPNGPGAARWAAFAPVGNIQSLSPPVPQAELDFAAEHNCGFWRGIIEQTAPPSVASILFAPRHQYSRPQAIVE